MDVLHVVTVNIGKCHGVAAAYGQLGNLVVVVAKACTQFPLPVLVVDDSSIDIELNTLVGELALIGPVLSHTRYIFKFSLGKQIVCLMPVDIDTCLQTVVQEATLQSNVPLGSGLPLDTAIGDVLQVKTYRVVGHLLAFPVSTCGVVVQIVVTAHIKACGQLQVVNTLSVEPFLVADEPAQLQ